MVQESCLLLLRQEFCRLELDPQQLVARQRHCAWTNSSSPTQHMILDTCAILQLVFMNFEIFCNASARAHEICEFCNSSARTHDKCDPSACAHELS